MAELRKPLDRTGKLSGNLIVDEPQSLVNRQVRVAVPEFGAFFEDGLIVKDAATNRVLVPKVEYAPADFYYLPSMEYGKGVFAEIVIYNTSVSNNVLLTYQAVGGRYSVNRTNIFAALDAVDLDDRPAKYDELVDRPWYLPPGPHQHDTGDTYGWEYITKPLKDILNGIVQGDKPTLDKLYADLDMYRLLAQGRIEDITADLAVHIADKDNPHELKAHDISVYIKAEVDAIVNGLATEYSNRSNAFDSTLAAHNANKNNPHQVTPGQLGSYTTAEFQQRLNDMIKKLASGSDGSWAFLYSGAPAPIQGPWDPELGDFPLTSGSWSWNNPYSKAVYVSSTVEAQYANNTIYVSGQLISDAFNTQAQDSDGKGLQGLVKVPKGGSITVYNFRGSSPGNITAYAFVPVGG